MSLKSIKDELAELNEENEASNHILVSKCAVSETRLVSPGGIEYIDPRPVRYCTEFEFLLKPTMTGCEFCEHAWNVTDMSHEERVWYLDPESGDVVEHGDGNNIPVTVFLNVAKIAHKGQERSVIVSDQYKNAAACPRHVYCEP